MLSKKKSYYEIIFLKFKDDIWGTWKTINDILNKIKHKKSFPHGGEIISTNKSIITNKFNSFFTNIGLNLSAKINMPRNKNFQNYLTHKYNDNFHFQKINEEIITSIIDKLAPKISRGFDGIFTKLVKAMKGTLITPITTIINQMLNTGIFPERLKNAKIIPIHKKVMKHYLQIINEFHFCLLFRKCLKKLSLNKFVNSFKDFFFYNAQYGFKTEHFTEYAAYELVDRVIVEMDKMNTPINIFLELSKPKLEKSYK